jgi:hypothetical protein
MDNQKLERCIKTLKEERQVLFKDNNCVFDISWSETNSGWYITGYTKENLKDNDVSYIISQDLCALCTGSARDAILFFVSNHQYEQQRELFLKIVKSSDVNIVTCGSCGQVVFHELKQTGGICCPYCSFDGEPCDFPDFY